MNKSMIEKVKKLLALANSDNENEAQLASKKAQELLLKHNISLATVESHKPEFVRENLELPKRQAVEAKFIHSLLIEFYFVQVVHSSRTNKLIYFGTEENIKVAMFVKSFLENAFKDLYRVEAKRQYWARGANRNAFYLGVYKGLQSKLEEQKKAVVTDDISKALLVVDRKLSNYIKGEFDNLSSRSNARINSNEATAIGKERGRSLNIARGLGDRNKSRTLSIA
ncbi:DUF2786 domain-containing protein [Candidatus Babeliales bacterium]|nr:DUF2786 domain-containing protein [Candidatus Babeliales bacterium]